MFDIFINGYPLHYVIWNLFLGIIPFCMIFLFNKINKNRKKSSLYIPNALVFFIWLIFLPNAPYIITDIRHINGFCPNTILDICAKNTWMIFFFMLYSISGWILYYYALEQMMLSIKNNFKIPFLNLFPLAISPIVALGLLLGLLDRLNSWDIAVRPIFVIKSSLFYLSDWQGFFDLMVTTVSLILLYYLGSTFFKASNFYKLK